MKLKVIKQEAPRKTCAIRCEKNGSVWFGKGVQAALNLEAGDKIDFMQDEENPKDFYLRKIGGSLELRKGTTASSLSVNNAPFVRAVGDIYDVKPPFSMRVSEKPNDEGVCALIMEG